MYNLTTIYINSGRNDRTEIITFIENESTDIIFIGEPHTIDDETQDREGYTKINTGTMVAGYAKTKVLEDIQNVTETEHTITITLKNEKTTSITAIYTPPGRTAREFEQMLNEIDTKAKNHTILGDTNARHRNWDKGVKYLNGYGKRLNDWALENEYELRNPYTKTHENSCIDHIWTKGKTEKYKVGLPILHGKHHMLHTTIQT